MSPSFESPRYLLLGACLLGCGSRSSLSTDALPASGTGGGGATTADTGGTSAGTTGSTGSTTTPTSTDACAGKPWTRTFAGDSYVVAYSVSADIAGDALVLGTFGTTVKIGTEVFSGDHDFFLTKLDGCGNPIWQKQIGHVGPGEVYIGRAAFDPSGNVLFAGTIEGLASIDGVELPALGGRDVVVAKFDPSGALLWAQRWGDAGHQEMSALLALPDGNLVVGGNFVGTLQIGDKTAASTVPYNVFVAELSPDGAPVADIFHFQGDVGAGLYSMASTPGGVAIGLQYLGQPVVPFLPETSTLDLAVLLVKDGAGVPLGTIHGGGDKYPTGLAVHPGTGRLIVTGYFSGEFFSDDGNVTYPYDGSGYIGFSIAHGLLENPDWTDAHFFTGGRCFPRAFVMDPVTGGAYLAGQFEGTVDFTGQGQLETSQEVDPFLARLLPEDASLFNVNTGGFDGDQYAVAVALGPNQEILLAGAFAGAMELDGLAASAEGTMDAFVFRYVKER